MQFNHEVAEYVLSEWDDCPPEIVNYCIAPFLQGHVFEKMPMPTGALEAIKGQTAFMVKLTMDGCTISMVDIPTGEKKQLFNLPVGTRMSIGKNTVTLYHMPWSQPTVCKKQTYAFNDDRVFDDLVERFQPPQLVKEELINKPPAFYHVIEEFDVHWLSPRPIASNLGGGVVCSTMMEGDSKMQVVEVQHMTFKFKLPEKAYCAAFFKNGKEPPSCSSENPLFIVVLEPSKLTIRELMKDNEPLCTELSVPSHDALDNPVLIRKNDLWKIEGIVALHVKA